MKNYLEEREKEFIELGADLEHDRWAKWQRYLHSKLIYSERVDGDKRSAYYVLTADLYERWSRQIDTDYSELSEEEKDSDRIEVRKYLPLINETIIGLLEKLIERLNYNKRTEPFVGLYTNGYNQALTDQISYLKELINLIK